MCLVRKANAQGYLAQRCRAGHHQMGCSLQTSADNEGMWRLADSQFELPREVRLASTRDRTEIPDVNGAV
jgi:hypothetical protein